MKKLFFSIIALMTGIYSAQAIDVNTVEIVYSGTTASVTIADNIASYVTVSSGTSSKVVIAQSNTDAVDNDEITYVLSGSSTAGSFTMSGSYKCTLSLNGLTLTNTAGPAIIINNGKRIKLSAKRDTESTITAKSNSTYNAAIWCKGHLELQGNGTLNVSDSYAHAIRAKEYVQIKNLTLNITSAAKDGINCKEYFWMKSGTVTISGISSDGIDVALDGLSSTGEIAATDTADAHEDEDSGNFYQDGGTLTITLPSSNTTGSTIQADGTIAHNGGTFNGTNYDTAINSIYGEDVAQTAIYDLAGKCINQKDMIKSGVYIYKNGQNSKKIVIR